MVMPDKESSHPLPASAAPPLLRKCASLYIWTESLNIQIESKSWGNLKYIADMFQRSQIAKWELVTQKCIVVLHYELHEGNSHCTTQWVLCQSEAAMIASSPECLRSAGKASEGSHFSMFCFHISFYTKWAIWSLKPSFMYYYSKYF